MCSPENSTFFPTDRAEATGIKVPTGKARFSNTFNMVRPTMPVAPTTATRS